MPEKRRITADVVKDLRTGTTVWDAEVRGFGVRRQSRDPVYVLKTRIHGRQRFLTIGRHQSGVMTPDRARREAQRLLGLVRDGKDPADERDRAALAPTVAEFCDRYLEDAGAGRLLLRRAGRPKKASTLTTDRSRISAHIKPLLGNLRLSEVTAPRVEEFMHQVATGRTARRSSTGRKRGVSHVRGGRGAASRTVGLLGAIFTYAVRRGVCVANPVRGVVRFADGKRQRRLSDAEYRALGAGLARASSDGTSPTGLAAIHLLVLTGWRRGEVAALRWDEVDPAGCAVRLSDSKTGAGSRPLGSLGAELIAAQPRTSSPFVFPSRVEGRPIQGLPRIWERVRTLAGLPADVTPHVLRHSFVSVGNDLKYTEATIGLIVGHSGNSTTRDYIHGADPVLLAATERISRETADKMGTPPIAAGTPGRQDQR